MVVGEAGDGWRVALATLAFERGVALLGHQVRFSRELDSVIEIARARGSNLDPVMRQRLAGAWATLFILRMNTLRSLRGLEGPLSTPEASIAKLFWSTWHRDLGELAMDVTGLEATAAALPTQLSYQLSELQRLFLFSRADTIYGGSNEIQRNIVAERVLGLPPEPKGTL
jgi:alkylation response protein AidB-like acyl-CoA dehydrogenase